MSNQTINQIVLSEANRAESLTFHYSKNTTQIPEGAVVKLFNGGTSFGVVTKSDYDTRTSEVLWEDGTRSTISNSDVIFTLQFRTIYTQSGYVKPEKISKEELLHRISQIDSEEVLLPTISDYVDNLNDDDMNWLKELKIVLDETKFKLVLNCLNELAGSESE